MVAHARALVDGAARTSHAQFGGLFDVMAEGWRLDGIDRDIAALVTGAVLDRAVSEVLAEMFGPGALTIGAVASIVAVRRSELEVVARCLGDARLVRAGLIETGALDVTAPIRPSARLVGLAQDQMVLHPTVASVATLVPLMDDATEGVTSDPPLPTLVAMCDAFPGARARGPVAIVGEPRSGRLRTALAIASALDHQRALVIDAPLVAEVSAWRTLLGPLISEAAFHVAAVVIRDAGANVLAPIARIADAGIPCFVTMTDEPPEGRCRIQARVVRPTLADRQRAWRAEAGNHAWATDARLEELAREHVLSRSAIATAATLAGSATVVGEHEAWVTSSAKSQRRSQLHRFARPITRRVSLDEIVLSRAVGGELAELVTALRARHALAARWGASRAFDGTQGVAALFDGPPGTGKTLSASVIATELDVPLFRIEVSTIVDRYVGETEKNLQRLFAEAEASRGILLFDEADSLFSRRVETKDAMDRFANMQVNQLLTLIEEYPGISILTTNLKQGLDAAFARRIPYKIEFDLPDASERAQLWRMYLPPGQLDSRAIAHLTEKFDRVSGAEIRNAVRRAAVLALDGPAISLAHVTKALVAELQSAGSVISMGAR